ncbi:hypothetical protein LTR53_004304 [Teratosphaeriaceae sp. CCFEE 6253]|nr:hypothetical protein LTR53_004304 [Teratosphaeriaceae sp. CCFEE 6253]
MQRVKNVDFDEDELYDDEGEYGEETGDSYTAEDRDNFAALTPVIRAELEEVEAQATDKEVQDALWNYYWDVGKSVAYLKNKGAKPQQQTAKKQEKPKSKFDQAAERSAKETGLNSMPSALEWFRGVPWTFPLDTNHLLVPAEPPFRQRQGSDASSRRPSLAMSDDSSGPALPEASTRPASKPNGHVAVAQHAQKPGKTSAAFHHRSARSAPSALSPEHKADILQGLLIVATCYVLMWFDASRIYHSIRGQSAIKLYVIYNVLEVFDRLFSALGQDILEVLFSKETLERNDRGRSKILRPFWLWVLALVYNVVHTTALFYQVVTLNVAVNSYSNALLTLLMSNQFVEIKSTVFKKIEKENLFQLTCADIVERFQLWHMLLIIAVRNIVEVGGLSISLTSALAGSPVGAASANATRLPLTSAMIIPRAFTMFPKWTGEVLGPFLIVLGSEALVDWCKHAYIGKFNNIKPNIYDRFLDVLAKDYYSHAFADQNLTKRLGLPVIPLSCLFIRACMQTYSMFIAAHLPPPMPSMATAVSLETETTTTSPATTAALQHIDHVFRRALGRSTFGAGSGAGSSFKWWSIDDLIAFGTMLTVFLAVFLILLALKLLLGMLLLTFARNRCCSMKERERQITIAVDGKRAGIGALTEVDESKRKWIYQDDAAGLQALREKEERGRKQVREKGDKLEGVDRYMMAAKRIW